jgi:periplasmic protein TonB
METNKILTANVLDIIFDGRNKLYGAYELRVTYNSRLKKSLLLTATFFLLIFLTTVFAGNRKKSTEEMLDVVDTELKEIKKQEVIPPTPPPVKVIPRKEVNQIQFTAPVIVNKEDVKEIKEITDEVVISNKTVKSDIIDAVVQAPVDIKESNVIEIPKTNDNEIVTIVEREAEFPGDNAAWTRYVQKNLDGFNPSESGAAPGKYQVIVRFVVSKDGTISDVQPETNFGYGMEELAVKCIKKGPNWKPALQNGINVNAYRRQPITFLVEE